MIRKWLIKPFTHTKSGEKLHNLGWVIMVLTACIAIFSYTHYDGILDIHVGWQSPFWVYFAEMLINWACLSTLFYATGSLLSRKPVSFKNISGAMAYARIPMLFAAIIGFIHAFPRDNSPVNEGNDDLYIRMVTLVFTMWVVALMYQAFAKCCNLKGRKAVVGFIVTLLVAEVISKSLCYLVYFGLAGYKDIVRFF